MEQAMIPIRVSRLSDWKIYGFQWGHLRSTLDRCGVFFCRAGEVELEIDNTPYIIKPGDICFYVASALVRVLRVGGEIDGVVVEVDVDYILPISNKVLNVQDILFMRDHPCITLTDAQCRYVDKLLELYMRRIKEGDGQVGSSKCRSLEVELIKAGGQALFYELLMIYYTNRPMHPVQRTQKDIIFQRFIVDLFNHYRAEREVLFYAERQNLSARYFSSVVKEKSGRSVLQWIIQMVISEAKQLLECSELSIKEIAVRLNFCTQSFFGKYFKQYVGMSPKEYRERSFYPRKEVVFDNQ